MREPLRLGSSTSGLSRCLPEDILKLTPLNTLSADDSDTLRTLARSLAEQITASQLRSLEYFTTLPMLELGLEHPIVAMLKSLGDGCEIWSVHAPFGGVDLASPDDSMRRKSVEDTKHAGELASDLGAKVLTVHPALELPDMEPRAARIEASGQSIGMIADHCAPMGITVAVEILPRKCIGRSLEELSRIIEIAGKPNVGICLDTNHSFPASALPEVIREIGSRLVTLHVSDNDDVDERHWLPMRGVIDWPAVIRSLKEIGYTGPFLYEAPLPGSDLSEGLAALESNYQELMTAAG